MSPIKALRICISIADVWKTQDGFFFRPCVDPACALFVLLPGLQRSPHRRAAHGPEALPEQRSPPLPPRLPRLPCRSWFSGGAGGRVPGQVQEVRRKLRSVFVLNFTLINIIVRNTQNCFQQGHLVLPKLLCILKQHFGVLLVCQPTDKKQNLGWNIGIFTDGHVSTIFFNQLLANWKLHFKLWGEKFSFELARDFLFFFFFFLLMSV